MNHFTYTALIMILTVGAGAQSCQQPAVRAPVLETRAASVAQVPTGAADRETTSLEIHGRVVAPSGAPVAGAQVGVWRADSQIELHRYVATSDDDGTFTVTVPDSEAYLIRARTKDRLLAASSVVAARPGVHEVVIRLRSGHTVQGIVVDDQGRAESRPVVKLIPVDNLRDHGWSEKRTNSSPFEFSSLEQGSYCLVATSLDNQYVATHALDVVDGTECERVVLALAPAGSLDVHFAGNGIANYRVLLNGTPVADGGMTSGHSTKHTVPIGTLILRIEVTSEAGTRSTRDCQVIVAPGETTEFTYP